MFCHFGSQKNYPIINNGLQRVVSDREKLLNFEDLKPFDKRMRFLSLTHLSTCNVRSLLHILRILLRLEKKSRREV